MLNDTTQIPPPTIPRSYGLGDALRTAVKEIWERFGLILGISFTWSLALFIGYTVGRTVYFGANPPLRAGLAVLLTAFLIAPATGGIFGIAWAAFAKEAQTYADFWQNARRFGGPVLRMALLHTAVVGLLGLNIWYWAQVHSLLGIVAALLSFDGLVVWAMMGIYHFPLLAAQQTGLFDTPDMPVRRGVFPVLRRAFFLMIGRPAYSFGLLVAALLLTVLSGPMPYLAFVLWPGAMAFLLTSGTRNLLVQFDVIPKG